MYSYSRNIVTVDVSALQHNYKVLKSILGPEKVLLAMVKADAYGHGMVESAKAFAEAGCSSFGVAEIGEGVELRQAGVKGDIFVFMGFQSGEGGLFFEYDLTPIVFLKEDLYALSRLGQEKGKVIDFHLKVDTGMGRLGFFADDVEGVVDTAKELPFVKLSGVVSHLACGDEPGTSANNDAFATFQNICDNNDLENTILHIANSAGVLNFPQAHNAFSRAGISLYGYYPDGSSGKQYESLPKLEPAMTFGTRVLQVKTFPAGKGISYGHTYTTDKETVIAVLPIGYEDGFSRGLSNCGEVLLHGKRARVCGRICMNLCMVDVSGIENVQSGDEVVVLGQQGDEVITADEIAAKCNTISYEVLCMFGSNNKRQYLKK